LCDESAQSAMWRNERNPKILSKCISVARRADLGKTFSPRCDDEFLTTIFVFASGHKKYIIFFLDFGSRSVADDISIILRGFFHQKCQEFTTVSTLENEPTPIFFNDANAIILEKLDGVEIGKV